MTNRNVNTDFPDCRDLVAFDFETTGLDPEHDEIIEIGMVRFSIQHEEEVRYSQLIEPSRPIPRSVTLLTGIRQEDVEAQPRIGETIPYVARFFGKEGWIVGHHVEFDLSFLRAAWKQLGSELPFPDRSRILDTLELSRILFPWLPNHRLETVAAFLGLPVDGAHRAAEDAAFAARVFRHMVPFLLELNASAKATVNRILNGANDGLRFLFERLESVPSPSAPPAPPAYAVSQNILGRRDDSFRMNPAEPPRVEIDGFFGEDGLIARKFPKFEARKPQQEMAAAVAKALNQDCLLVAEAGTGVGKSLAYLIPVVLRALQAPDEKSVISTHTKTLQDQLFFKDLPLVRQVVDKPFLAVLLKGRNNYICLERFRALLDHLEEKLDRSERRCLLPLTLWIHETRTGDIDENPGFVREANGSVWLRIQSESSACRGMFCPHEADCFVQRIHRAAKIANLVVVNHALLFASIAQNRSVLGAFDTLVVDEAHQIERVASQYLGVVLEERGVRETVHLVAALKPKETGLVNAFRHALNRALRDDSERERASRWLDALKDAAQQTAAAARQFFASVAEAFAPEDSSNGRSVRPRIRIRNSLAQRVPDAFERFERSLDTLKRELAEGVGMAREWDLDTRPDSEALGRELETVLERAGTLLESLVHFRGVDFEKHAVWIEFVDTERGREPILHSVPIEVASLLANRLYPRVRRGVWTSATLTVGDRFDYLMVRWGLNWVEPDRCTTRVFGSPFDFREQALLAVTTFLSNPRERRYVREVAAVLGRVLVEHPRGTLVLFTSYAMLREVYEAVRPVLDERGIRLLGQGIDGSRSFLLRMFQSDVRSVLFGTSSFWEGIDVPGAALELLVITKIPFDVPTDPLIEARMEKVQAETGNGFLHYAVPEAVVKLRQGFGRLIRTAEDRGAVLVLDPRVTQTAYGPLFLKSLPVEPALCDDESSLFSTLKEWFC